MNRRRWLLFAVLLATPTGGGTQILTGPSLPPPVGGIVRDLGTAIPQEPLARQVDRQVRTLARTRLARLAQVAQQHPDAIEVGRDGNPVRAREILVEDPDEVLLAV